MTVREGSYVDEDTLEYFITEEVVEGMNRELDLMQSFPVCQAVPRTDAIGIVWSTRWCRKEKGHKQARARFLVRQFATSLDAVFYSTTLVLEVTRVLLVISLLKDLKVFVCDVTVAFMNTGTPEGEPVHVEPLEGLN